MALDLGDGPAHQLHVLVLVGARVACLDALGEEQMHPLTTEPRRRPERRHKPPVPAVEARLLCELATGRLRRLLTLLERSRRQLHHQLPRRLTLLADERDVPLAVDRDHCDRARMLDDLPLVVAPAL